MSIYLDLVAGGLVSLPVGPGLSSAVAPHHILIQLLRDIQVCHSNQVTAMLQAKRWEGRREDDETRVGRESANLKKRGVGSSGGGGIKAQVFGYEACVRMYLCFLIGH